MKLRSVAAALPLAAALFIPVAAVAHDVPDEVQVRMYLRPVGGQMQILVRMPVNALIDTLFPLLPDSGFLDLPQTRLQTADAARLWIANLLTIHEGDTVLALPRVVRTMISRENDTSFATYQEASAHVEGPPLPDKALVVWDRAFLDVLLETPVRSVNSDFALVPRFARLGIRVTTDVGFVTPSGAERDFEYDGDPGMFRLDPSRGEAAARFVRFGFLRILEGHDHLIFLFCAVLLLTRLAPLAGFAVLFSVAHSAAFLASALLPGPGPGWLPAATFTLMAVSLVYLALECAIPTTPERFRPLIAIGAGLAFGPAFWFYLQPDVQFGGAQRLISVLAYNAGIEASQFLALAIMFPAMGLFFRFCSSRRMWTVVFAGFAAHLAWHKMTERAFLLDQATPFHKTAPWPASALRAAALAALGLGIIATFIRRRKEEFQ